MPSYSYACACGWGTVKRYTSVPDESKRKATTCEECGKQAERDYATDITSVGVTGGQKGTIEKEVSMAMEKDSSGRPIYRDLNGKVHEVRSAADVDAYTQNLGQNPFAKPRMVEFRNPVTGEKSWEPARVGGYRADPETGQPVGTGAIIKEQQKMIPLGQVQGEYIPPSFTPGGAPLVNGVMPQVPASQKRLGMLDPVTGKPITMADLWGEPEIPTKQVVNKRPPPGMKWG